MQICYSLLPHGWVFGCTKSNLTLDKPTQEDASGIQKHKTSSGWATSNALQARISINDNPKQCIIYFKIRRR